MARSDAQKRARVKYEKEKVKHMSCNSRSKQAVFKIGHRLNSKHYAKVR